MKRTFIMLLVLVASNGVNVLAQKTKTDANIIGHVVSKGEHLAYANISLKGTTIGTLTDATGHYFLTNIPEGSYIVEASYVGYKTMELPIVSVSGKIIELNFELEKDVLGLDEVVVSGNRNNEKRVETPLIINSITPAVFEKTQSQSLADGLNYCPGLRIENNCQNCGFNQVRMNGMEGHYTQILINGHPIFSGLAGVYGLELIPASIIERVEVVRGGGSAMYGGGAIAGTLNLILKDPVVNSYEAGFTASLMGLGIEDSSGAAPDYSLSFNTSLISDDYKTGMTLYGFSRNRYVFDANGDGFSEIAPIENLTLGTRIFHRFGYRNKIAFDFFNITEKRNGGNRQETIDHERDVSESLKHNIKAAALTYDQFIRDYDLLQIFIAGQFLDRDSYYGANRSLSDYGRSSDRTYNAGGQYKAVFHKSAFILGVDHTGGFLRDIKMGYPDYENALIENDSILEIPHVENIVVADQSSQTTGAFLQYELKAGRFKMLAGGRFDRYLIKDFASATKKQGGVFVPRISLMYDIFPSLQARVGYSQGYRAPQIFDEDLHIETSGSRKVINVNDPELSQENSFSITSSFDFNKSFDKLSVGLMLEAFHTLIDNPFFNEIGNPDDNGLVIYTRRNATSGAFVQGFNIELKLSFRQTVNITSGITIQRSEFEEVHEFNEKRFFRTPSSYGFLTSDFVISRNFNVALTGNYTGKMLVPYFGPNANPEIGELRVSHPFFDAGIKLSYSFKLNGARMQISGGLKNIFNSYQRDFDIGIDRDPSYIYGNTIPRTIYFSVKIGNLL